MSHASRIDFGTATQDTTKRTKRVKIETTRPAARTKAERAALARSASLRRKIAYGIGGVGVGVLALSVVHCTEAIDALTGSPWYLGGPLAVGIDAGMVLAELAELISGDDKALRRWARGYIGLSVALSMAMNAYAFSRNSPVPAASIAIGLIIPMLVLMLGRIAGHLAK